MGSGWSQLWLGSCLCPAVPSAHPDVIFLATHHALSQALLWPPDLKHHSLETLGASCLQMIISDFDCSSPTPMVAHIYTQVCVCVCFETGSCVTQVILELFMYPSVVV